MVAINNNQIEGYWNVMPELKTVDFPSADLMRVELVDGRTITLPLDRFPSISQLTPEQRQQWYHYGNGFSFDDSDEVIHIEQILGNFQQYRHEA
jgi:hypothetical protein